MNVNISIDGRSLVAQNGLTILQAAHLHDLYIPTLCDYPGLPPHGSCRMCIVEILGRQNTPTACTTPVEEGMVVQTNSPKVQALRVELLQLLLAEHPSSCLFCAEKFHCDECMITLRKAGVTTGCRSCSKDGMCNLQLLVDKIGITQADYPVRYRMLKAKKDDPFIDRDYNLCVLCGRCIRICDELHFASSINYTKRGKETVIGTAFNKTLLNNGCSFCGACVEICPTGALSEKTRKWDGVPEQETATTCPYCSIGCQISLLSKNNTVIGSLPNHQAGCDSLCVKGGFGISELVNHPTRLTQPQKSVYQSRLPVSWEETIQLAAEKLSACPPEQFEMIISSNCSNEDLYVAHKFCRKVIKSTNIHSPALDKYKGKFGSISRLLKKSQSLAILAESSTILCLGLDGHYFQSVVEVELHRAKTRGARLISIHSNEHSFGKYAEEWLQPIPGKESDLVKKLSERICDRSNLDQPEIMERIDNQLERTARILRESKDLAVLIGPNLISNSNTLLDAVENLVNVTGGQVILLLSEANLGGAVLMGISPQGSNSARQPKVIYLIGEAMPINSEGQPFILYQNIYLLPDGNVADLSLPASAFSEGYGTIVDYSGRVKEIRRAVEPPGEALPTWEILSRIAQKMEVEGFNYTCAEEIQKEITKNIGNYRINEPVTWPDLSQEFWGPNNDETGRPEEEGSTPGRSIQISDHSYMGYPLMKWVEGLRMIFPGDGNV